MQNGAAADAGKGVHLHRNAAAGQTLRYDIGLRRHLLLAFLLGSGSVQQNVHRQISDLILLISDEHTSVRQTFQTPGPVAL